MSNVTDEEFLNAICRENLDSFTAKGFSIVEPGEQYEHNWHIECINYHLQALHEDKLPGGKKRLCINVPPRSLKSFSASISFPAWVMGKNPAEKFICTSHKGSLAKEMAQKSRILMESDWYGQTFPNTKLDSSQNEKHNFWTTQRGFYYSSPILSVTGKGGSYVIIDDPVNPTEAMSPGVRTETNDTISRTLPTRFNNLKNAKWLMIMQRLHDDDPTGHFVLGDDRWYMLKLPGENLTGKDIVYELGGKKWVYKAGDLLFPERLTRDVLDGLRTDLGEYNYAGQVLQEPVPLSGGMFNPAWVQFYKEGGIKPTEMNVVILCDPAGGEETNKKKRKLSDWSAFMVVGLGTDNNYYLLDAVRDRLNPTERVETLFMLHRKWNQLCGKPPKVGYEKYGMMADTHYIEEKKKQDAYNFALVEVGGSTPKEDRISRLVPDMQTGRWYFPTTLFYVDGDGRKFDLVKEILEAEMPTFPRSRHDDMCFAAGTMIATKDGNKAIEDIAIGDMVLTPDGYKEVYNCGCTGKYQVINKIGLCATPNHPIYTIDESYKRLDTISSSNKLLENSLCGWIKIALLKSLSSMESSIDSWEEAEGIIYRVKRTTKSARVLKAYMSRFGNFIMEGQFLKVARFITSTVIHLTICLRIWIAYRLKNTEAWSVMKFAKGCANMPIKYGLSPKNGIGQMKEEHGIVSKLREMLLNYSLSVNTFVSNVIQSLFLRSQEELSTVPTIVGTKVEKQLMYDPDTREHARHALKSSWDRIRDQNTVQDYVLTNVYNISVKDSHCYFANGILVHNCDALSRIYEPDLNLMFPKPKVGMVKKAMASRDNDNPDWTEW